MPAMYAYTYIPKWCVFIMLAGFINTRATIGQSLETGLKWKNCCHTDNIPKGLVQMLSAQGGGVGG